MELVVLMMMMRRRRVMMMVTIMMSIRLFLQAWVRAGSGRMLTDV